VIRALVLFAIAITLSLTGLTSQSASAVAPTRKSVRLGFVGMESPSTALPIEQPTEYRLVVNLNAARELGITIPDSILIRADQVIR